MYTDPSASVTYNRLQQVFCLNLLSNVAGSKTGSNGSLTDFADQTITAVLADSTVTSLIGSWTVPWGPEVITAPALPLKNVAANTMFVAQQTGEDGVTSYVIAIAGTNPNSLYGWFGEDFIVQKTLAWTTALTGVFGPVAINSDTTVPYISEGTADGLQILINQMSSAGQTLIQFLTAEIAAATGPVEVIVTGHSLGGALSASVALLLADNQGPGTSLPWDPTYKAVVSAVPSAGAPPGNIVFAKHYDAVLGTRTNRLWNSLDVIPHAWEPDLLVQAPHLYFPYIAPNLAVRTLVDLVLGYVASSKQTYQQINRQTPPLQGQVDIAAATAETSFQNFAIDEIASIIAGKIARAFGWPDSVKSALTELILAVLQVIEEIAKSKKQVNPLQDLGNNVTTDVQSIRSWLKTLGDDVEQDFSELVALVAKELGAGTSQLEKLLAQLLQDAQNAIANLASKLKTVIKEIVQTLTRIIAWALPLLAQLATEMKVALEDVLQYLPGIAAFLSQLVIQHVPAYAQLLGVTQYAAIQKQIRSSIPYPPPGPA